MTPAEKKSIVFAVAGWIWEYSWLWDHETVQVTFDQQRATSQLVVDAVIGTVPVGEIPDVRDVRYFLFDLFSQFFKMAEPVEKRLEIRKKNVAEKAEVARWREEEGRWLELAVSLFVFVPEAREIGMGVGYYLLQVRNVKAEHATLLRQMIEQLNRLGRGDAGKFIEELSVEKYAPELLSLWQRLVQGFDSGFDVCLKNLGSEAHEAMVERLVGLRAAFMDLAAVGERMIPECVKDLGQRVLLVQRAMTGGDATEGDVTGGNGTRAPNSFKSLLRRAFAAWSRRPR